VDRATLLIQTVSSI
jgi:hypothetical protein